jgi:hypothetical protein
MNDARFDHTATLLGDGNVLVTGGEGSSGILNSCEIYSLGSWSSVDNMNTARARHTAVLLLDGRVMVIGGETSPGTPTNSCEIWDGTNWSSVASLNTARSLHTAILLQSGKVLVIGGKDSGGNALASCEIYDPVNDNWTEEGNLIEGRYLHNATLLYSGLVLVSGGYNGTSYLSSSEIWDPAAEYNDTTNIHRWKQAGTMIGSSRGYHVSVLIPTIKPYVYTFGGYDGSNYLNSIHRHDVGLGYKSNWQSTIKNYHSVTPISNPMEIEGTLFRDLSEADGGNYCHIVSSDHPIISLIRVGGGNWQGNSGGDIMYMPYSTDWSETHTTIHPVSSIQGYYRLWAIVNGIPTKWYEGCALKVEEKEIENQYLGHLQIYPNPSMGFIFIKFSGNVSSNFSISIYDCAGRLIKTESQKLKTTNQQIVKLEGLRTGIYFYKVKFQNSEIKGKFIVICN